MVHAVCFRFSAANVFGQVPGTFLVCHGETALFDAVKVKYGIFGIRRSQFFYYAVGLLQG